MKHTLLISCIAVLLMACGSDDKKAQVYLERAGQLFSQGAYSEAKSQIDSIRTLYPKAFDTRKEAIKLMRQIELEEQGRTLAYLDSAYRAKQAELDSIKGAYVLEKDTAYQEVGNYFSPSQTVERNLNRTFLRAQVSEQGVMSLTSIYCGRTNIHHTAIKVTDLGWKIEKADYVLGQDSSVIDFIVMHADAPVRVEFLGDRNYKMALPASDRKAIADVYRLAQVLSAMEEIRKEQKEANLKKEFIRRKMEEDAAE